MRLIHLVEIELSKLGSPALGAIVAFVSAQPWLTPVVGSMEGVGGAPITELARGLVNMMAAGAVSRLYLVLCLTIAGYVSYSTFSDFNSGMAQTLLSYPVSRRSYFYSKLLSALAVAVAPAAYSAALWTASLVEEDLSWVPLWVIIASITLQALPAVAWSLLASASLKRNFVAAMAFSAAPWIVLARLEPEGRVRYALPWAYPEALAVGSPLPAILSSLSITLACLGLLEIVLSRLEVD